MAAIETHNYPHQSSVTLSSSDEIDDESAESLLASVREQEQQFALLSKEIEEERRSVEKQLHNNKMVHLSVFCSSHAFLVQPHLQISFDLFHLYPPVMRKQQWHYILDESAPT